MKFKSCILLYYCLYFFTFSAVAQTYPIQSQSVWDALRAQFKMSHEIHRPEVKKQLKWIMMHPTYIQKLSEAEPYIYHILNEIKQRKLPGEIALLPMIESAYDPFAYSGAGAAGLWQLMPETGKDLGVKKDWWFDGRRSVCLSTKAALSYLEHLNQVFRGSWVMALAAYDSGQGTMIRALQKARQQRNGNFWNLGVPRETKNYIPKLLALAEVIQHPGRYNLKLPYIPNQPYFKEVNIGSQIDLENAAKLAGIPYRELINLNAGFNRWATAPYQPHKLLVPANKAKHFVQQLADTPEDKRVSWIRHQVSSGETLITLAKKYSTTLKLIQELNQLPSTQIKAGTYILIPSNKNLTRSLPKTKISTAQDKQHRASAYKVIHIVQKSDTYNTLVHKYHVTESEIRHWNMLSPKMPLKRGQQLIIWKRSPVNDTYIIQPGDNLSLIAKRHRMKLAALISLNPQFKNKLLKPGQKLTLQ